MSGAPFHGRRRGKFITLEGGEGAGKSTQIQHVRARLARAQVQTIATREPGGSPRAEALRELLLSGAVASLGVMAEALIFSAARIDHLDELIRPALKEGVWVVCDRFSDSTRAYQGALGNLDPRLIAALEAVAVGQDKPDLTLILDIDPAIGLARAHARRRPGEIADRFESETLAFHQALRATFREIAAAEPARCALVDASGEEEAVAEAVWSVIEQRLLSARQRARARGLRLAGTERSP